MTSFQVCCSGQDLDFLLHVIPTCIAPSLCMLPSGELGRGSCRQGSNSWVFTTGWQEAARNLSSGFRALTKQVSVYGMQYVAS